MSQFTQLWAFQQADMKADHFEAEMRKAPNRQKLLSQRNFLLTQQTNIKQIEADVADMLDRMEAVKDDVERLGKLSQEQAKVDAQSITDLDEIRRHIESAQKLVDSLSRYEQEVQKMSQDGAHWDRQQKEIRVRSAKIKQEFDQIKAVYDEEFKQQSAQLEELREQAKKMTAGIDAALLKKYEDVKNHVSPPVAKLEGSLCGGCRMSLPSVVLRDIRAGERTVECDNCGRILMVDE